jgi:hypothetical protein
MGSQAHHDKDARADHSANAKRRQRERAKYSLQMVLPFLLRFGKNEAEGFTPEEICLARELLLY